MLQLGLLECPGDCRDLQLAQAVDPERWNIRWVTGVYITEAATCALNTRRWDVSGDTPSQRQEGIMSVIRKSLVFAAVLFGFCVSTAHAQGMIIVKVPFPFVAGQKTFPAGQYEIRGIDTGAVLAIKRMSDPSSFGFLITNSLIGYDPAGDQPSLVFTRSLNEYRLSQIWNSTSEGRELPGVSATQEDARADKQGGVPSAQTYLLAANWK
jgi:hypothetical protein